MSPITVKDLIRTLEFFRDEEGFGDTEVYFSYDYGDQCHKRVAIPATSVGQEDVVYSEYTQSMVIFDGDGEFDNTAIIIS